MGAVEPNTMPANRTTSRKRTVLVVGIVALVSLACIGLFVAVRYTVTSLRASPIYRDAAAIVQSDERVIAALGEPLELGAIRARGGRTSPVDDPQQDHLGDWIVGLSGPKGKGRLHIQGDVDEGRVKFVVLYVTVGDQRIDLLEGRPEVIRNLGDCRQSRQCSEEGLCNYRDGKCVASTHKACAESKACGEQGRCNEAQHRCVATTDEDCRNSKRCRERGQCKLSGDACVGEGRVGPSR